MPFEIQQTRRSEQQPSPSDPVSEVRMLREVLNDAVRALARCGVTPAAFSRLLETQQKAEPWRSAVRVWTAAGVPPEPMKRIVLRSTAGARKEERVFPCRQSALNAAIAAIETNESYPEAIEVDGLRVMDRASILRAWGDRHDPG